MKSAYVMPATTSLQYQLDTRHYRNPNGESCTRKVGAFDRLTLARRYSATISYTAHTHQAYDPLDRICFTPLRLTLGSSKFRKSLLCEFAVDCSSSREAVESFDELLRRKSTPELDIEALRGSVGSEGFIPRRVNVLILVWLLASVH